MTTAHPTASEHVTTGSHDPSRGWRGRLELALLAATVVLGSVLIVVTALNQPYNQNEFQQLEPYASPDLGTAVSGTRQPPLDPLLGVAVERLRGEGHLEQRLVPIGAGIGSLVAMAVLLWRLRLGWYGVGAMTFMATAPLFLRYSAYTRPYALPLFLMVLCVLAGTRWLDTGRTRWLVVALGSAFLLPLARVPEPTVFLASAAVVLGVVGRRHRPERRRCWWLAGALLLGLATSGIASLLALVGKTDEDSGAGILDPHPGHAIERVPTGLRELRDYVGPLYADWFPWWPVVVLTVVLAAVLAGARRQLRSLWFWLPMVLAPLVFLVAYHTVNDYPLDIRHYRIRFAYFWVPPLVVLVAVVAATIGRSGRAAGRWLGAALVAALVVGQLPATWAVLTENDAVDQAGVARLVRDRVPENAVVVFTGPGETTRWRQPFFGQELVRGDPGPPIRSPRALGSGRDPLLDEAPIYLLLLDGPCVSSVVCDAPATVWSGEVDGYEQIARYDRFRLFAPTQGQRGEPGTATALLALVDAFGPLRSVSAAAGAAVMLARTGREAEAERLVEEVCESHPESARATCRQEMPDRSRGRSGT